MQLSMCVPSTTYHRPCWYKFHYILQKQPQCMGCGVVYPYLKGLLCGTCLNRSEPGMSFHLDVIHGSQFYQDPTIDGTSFAFKHVTFWPREGQIPIVNLVKRIKHFEASASEHWLNQHPKNSSLQSAEKVKEKLVILKKQVKTEHINVNVQLWIYPEGKTTACKV